MTAIPSICGSATHEKARYSQGMPHSAAVVLICSTGKGYTYTWPDGSA